MMLQFSFALIVSREAWQNKVQQKVEANKCTVVSLLYFPTEQWLLSFALDCFALLATSVVASVPRGEALMTILAREHFVD